MYRVIILTIFLALLSSCAGKQPTIKPETECSSTLEEGIHAMANDLLKSVQEDSSWWGKTQHVVLKPFDDTNSGGTTKGSRKIEELIIAEGQKFKSFVIDGRLTEENRKNATHVINGKIDFLLRGGKRFSRVSAAVVKQGSEPLASSSACIPELENERVVEGPIQKPSPSPDLNRLPTGSDAVFTEAETAFDERNYSKALERYKEALTLFNESKEEGEHKRDMVQKTYAGLYQTNLKLKDVSATEDYFAKLVAFTVDNYKILSVRFLFQVDKTEFEERVVEDDYPMLLRQIGKYFSQGKYCLHMIGHGSHTGKEERTQLLSELRAKQIQNLLEKDFPDVKKKSTTQGKGWHDAIGGEGVEDVRDRRVVFQIVDCPDLGKPAKEEWETR